MDKTNIAVNVNKNSVQSKEVWLLYRPMTCNSCVGTQPATILGIVTVANQAEYPAAKCN